MLPWCPPWRAHYERLGVASYWLLDPTSAGRIEVLELADDGSYRAVAQASGDETVTVERPYAVTVCPAELLTGLRTG